MFKVASQLEMDAMQQQEMAKAGLQRITADIKRIKSTLNRLDSEDYGYCLKCGDQIDSELLTFNPSIISCRSCRKLE